MVIRVIVIASLVCLCHLAGNLRAQQVDEDALEAVQFAAEGVLASDVSRAGQGTGLPWANGRFVYEFSPEVNQQPEKTESFEAACRRLLENTALKCVNRSQAVAINDRDYVYVVDGGRDSSYVGRQGGKQILSILIWDNPNIISHEIKHALGWGHEHQHPDRDRYVDILFENIPQEKQENFYVYDNGNEGEYDFDSVMHYYPSDFARPARKSIRARPEFKHYQRMMGQRDHLSEIDLLEIQQYYGDPSVEWCGVNRKPDEKTFAGCSYACRLEPDPAVGTWVVEGVCDSTKG